MNPFHTPRLGASVRPGPSPVVALVGLVLILASVGLLIWNELNVRRADAALGQGAGAVISIAPDPIDPKHEGALVHVVGQAAAASPVADPDWGVTASGLRLDRRVSMYQHVRERRRGATGDDRHRYVSRWSERPEDTTGLDLGRSNPPFPVQAARFHPSDARLGAFSLNAAVLDKTGQPQLLALDEPAQAAARAAAARNGLDRPVHVTRDGLYLGADPSKPRIGDMRISYAAVPSGVFTIAGVQSGAALTPYVADGRPLLLVKPGVLSAAALFETAQGENGVMLWVYRGGGLALLLVGSVMLLLSARSLRKARRA